MSKKIILILTTIGIFFIIGLVLLFYFFPTSSLCKSPDKRLDISAKSAIFSPDGNDIAFGKWEKVWQSAQGICAFPNGGGFTAVEQISIYKNPINTPNTPILLSVIPIPDRFENEYELLGWDDTGIYLSLGLSYTTAEEYNIYYHVNPSTKEFFELKESEIGIIKTKFPKKNRSDLYPHNEFDNKTMYLLNKEKIGLGLYTQDEDRNKLIDTMPQILEKIIVSEDILYNPSFPNDYKKIFIEY